ncbi:MAG: hypothetical protein ACK55I_00600, partial [bacterium]
GVDAVCTQDGADLRGGSGLATRRHDLELLRDFLCSHGSVDLPLDSRTQAHAALVRADPASLQGPSSSSGLKCRVAHCSARPAHLPGGDRCEAWRDLRVMGPSSRAPGPGRPRRRGCSDRSLRRSLV